MQINPQQISPVQQGYTWPQHVLGAPTVGNNQMNQIPSMNNYNNFEYNAQMQIPQINMMQGQNNSQQQQGNYNK